MDGHVSIFFSEDSLQKSFTKYWVIGKGSMVFTKWNVGFDPLKEKLKRRHLWVLFLGFPLHRSTFEAFKVVSNTIVRFILVEEETFMASVKKMSRILVSMEVTDGFPKEVEVMWDGGIFF